MTKFATPALAKPTPAEVLAARKASGLSQTEAAALVTSAEKAAYKTWSAYEAELGTTRHRDMPSALWELFLLKTNQHPVFRLRSHPAK